jgi:TonB family protein
MAAAAQSFDDGQEPNRRWVWILLGVLALAALAYGIWTLSNTTVGKEKKEPPTFTAVLAPPPPPPPPPPPQEKPPEPTETIKPVPTEVPTPAPEKPADAPAAVSIDAAATGAGDAFGLQGGGPGGMGGVGSTGTGTGPAGGISDRFYRTALGKDLEDRVGRQNALKRQLFSAEVDVWVDPRGRVTKVTIVRSSGDAARDEKLVAAIESIKDLDPPPTSIVFPARVRVGGRKSLL